mmetsp:Transcript_11023/g.23945  ORF Transcript_11023/g.23945 Transcript_11023/m.23945 type:complete len:173 (-) Transcript_11023:66-584(-)
MGCTTSKAPALPAKTSTKDKKQKKGAATSAPAKTKTHHSRRPAPPREEGSSALPPDPATVAAASAALAEEDRREALSSEPQEFGPGPVLLGRRNQQGDEDKSKVWDVSETNESNEIVIPASGMVHHMRTSIATAHDQDPATEAVISMHESLQTFETNNSPMRSQSERVCHCF